MKSRKKMPASIVDANGPSPSNVIPLIPAGKIMCYVSSVLRPDTPEENVRQRWARSLIDEYGYVREDMAVEFKIKMGTAKKKADIVIFKPGSPKKQENIWAIVEAKRADVLPRAKLEGVEQLKSYMAASMSCEYGIWVGAEKLAFQKLSDHTLVDVVDLPRRGDTEAKIPTFSELVPALDLKATLRRCHNYIYVNQGMQKAEAFHEVLKLIFCKVYDETESSGALRFFIRNEERRSEAGQRRVQEERIDPLFAAVRDRYPYIFKQTEKVELNRRVLAYLVGELQKYSLLRTQTDVKGDAYEELVGANLRGDRGEYFSPRNICDMTLQMLFASYPRQRLSTLKVLDCCCGTGGFLVSAINELRRQLMTTEAGRGGSKEEIEGRASARIKELAALNIFALDINPLLVKTCQMNLVMHGDGSSNVFQADSLSSPSEWDNVDAASKVGYGKFDIVVTNPPFGGKAQVDDPHILSRYELSTFASREPRSVIPAEQLFVEVAMKYLKPGGRLGIVLPDSILNNPSLEFLREWLFKRSRIVASVDLPKETFADSGGVPNPSVLIVQKFSREELRLEEAGVISDYPVFMAIPKTAGRDKRGNRLYYKTQEGFEILDSELQPLVDDEIPSVVGLFAEWVAGGGLAST
jgi:type I restriction enzyme M protein